MSQKKVSTQDLRVVRTRRMLRDAMIALTIQKGFDTVTINDIVGLAMVNRATFYRHYQDKYDLVESYLDDHQVRYAVIFKKITGAWRAQHDLSPEAHESVLDAYGKVIHF